MIRIFLLCLSLTIAACGVKGDLKRPSQVKADALKKEQKLREKPPVAE